MTRKERAKLRTQLRELIERRQSAGERFTSSAVYDFAMEELSEVMAESVEPLTRLAVRDMAQKIMGRKGMAKSDVQTASLFDHANIRLPRSITLPQEGGDLLWTPLDRVTPNEWQSHIDRVISGGEADIASGAEQQAALDMLKEQLEPEELDLPIHLIKRRIEQRRAS